VESYHEKIYSVELIHIVKLAFGDHAQGAAETHPERHPEAGECTSVLFQRKRFGRGALAAGRYSHALGRN
jgi:hypothetical protein